MFALHVDMLAMYTRMVHGYMENPVIKCIILCYDRLYIGTLYIATDYMLYNYECEYLPKMHNTGINLHTRMLRQCKQHTPHTVKL